MFTTSSELPPVDEKTMLLEPPPKPPLPKPPLPKPPPKPAGTKPLLPPSTTGAGPPSPPMKPLGRASVVKGRGRGALSATRTTVGAHAAADL